MPTIPDRLPELSGENGGGGENERLLKLRQPMCGIFFICIEFMSFDREFTIVCCGLCTQVCKWFSNQGGKHGHEHCRTASSPDCAKEYIKLAA
jgi:hypothetical protein